jgi:uncharacterized membrane protein YgcG
MGRISYLAVVAVCLLILNPTQSSAADAARLSLNRTLPTMNFAGVALVDAIDFLRDVSNANIHVDWRALETAGVGKDTVVNLRLRSVSMRKVLTLLLSEASGGGPLLTFYAADGVIEITTREIADRQMFTRVYPIQDLIMEVPDFVGPDFNITQANTGGGRGGGGGGQSIFGGGGASSNDSDQVMTRAERAQQLIDVITETIQPDIWATNGGTAAIRFFNGNLIVTAPRSVHEALGGNID